MILDSPIHYVADYYSPNMGLQWLCHLHFSESQSLTECALPYMSNIMGKNVSQNAITILATRNGLISKYPQYWDLTLTCSVIHDFVILKHPQAASSGWQLHPLNFSVCISGTSDPLMTGWVTSSGRDFLRTEQETIICSRRQSFTSTHLPLH